MRDPDRGGVYELPSRPEPRAWSVSLFCAILMVAFLVVFFVDEAFSGRELAIVTSILVLVGGLPHGWRRGMRVDAAGGRVMVWRGFLRPWLTSEVDVREISHLELRSDYHLFGHSRYWFYAVDLLDREGRRTGLTWSWKRESALAIARDLSERLAVELRDRRREH